MVCCDECETWYHFRCVGVTASIENVDWRCAECCTPSRNTMAGQEKGQEGTCDGLAKNPNAQGNGGAHAQNVVDAEVDVHGVPRSSASGKSAKMRRQRAEAALLEEELQILRKREALIERRRKLLQNLETEDECSDLDEGLDSTAVEKWLNATVPTLPNSAPPKTPHQGHKTPAAQPAGPSVSLSQPKEAPDDRNFQHQIQSLLEKVSILEQSVHNTAVPATGATWIPKLVPKCSSSPTDPKATGENVPMPSLCLTKNQIAARTSVGKDLPKFNGKPEDWPLFLATYQQTTELCGLSEGENLLRLRHALEGAAWDAVRNLLLHTSCVSQIIDTLRMKFGRPELIIAVLVTRIREIPVVKENRLEALVDLALEVQNVCATMKASNMLCYLNNPELEQELVNKLPGLLAAFWGMHKLQLSSCNLENFADWLLQLAQGARRRSVLVPSVTSKPSTKRGYLNAHAGDVRTGKHSPCVICHGKCSTTENCSKFRAADRAERWNLVRLSNLCRRCLKVHPRLQCPSDVVCGIDGCVSIHHPLLHKQRNNPVSSPLVNSTLNTHSCDTESILFRVLPVTLHAKF
ncbi:PREDICTED: uncharacterized protein LOC108359612 [Rhagoletis zephyria]|uniref:uncharacterized protein LOC108359612 n=1 Tax=Rhagoletis zephyria TaxID=28612 RepID=UPI0008115493|nr:PREDICTED: uncharacterized protein LOC108359612 [Rhagoletis zephyria]